ncbi:MAG: arylsulfatase [Parvibaculum sp.]
MNGRIAIAKCVWAFAVLVLVAGSFCCGSAFAETKPDRPNIVLLLVDDAALMDFGVYGGEAHTPNIDALAARGALFTQYRSSPLCAPSRAMLLTGMDNHRTGVATIPEIIPPEQEGKPGYTLSLEPGVATLADDLKAAGYRTFMTGKWHLGSEKGDLPVSHGFDRSFALDASGADNWEDKSFIPFYSEAPWFEDDKPASLPKDFYSSKFLIDKMIQYIGESDASLPFFAYVAFQAIHIPVQAPPEFTAHYIGVYEEGWNVLRARRHQRAVERGLIPEGAPLAPMPHGSRSWDSLSKDEQTLYAARMQVNAGMLEAMDHHVGRLIDYLKANGLYDNMIFVVTSDNGPAPSRGDNDRSLALWMKFNGYHIGMKNIGERGSWTFIGPEWANAAASPSDLFKFYAAEGGLRVPFIIAGPDIAPQRVQSFAMVTDVAPTLLDLAKVTLPDNGQKPMTGRSLVPVLHGDAQQTYGPDDVAGIEVSGNAALYLGHYKITRNLPPLGDGQWRLFDIKADPGETKDLSADRPAMREKLLTAYYSFTDRVGVLEMPEGYNSNAQLTLNVRERLIKRFWWMSAISLGLVPIVLFLIGRMIFRRRAS